MTSRQEKERKRVVIAVVASLLLHVVIALSLAAFNRSFASVPPPDDAPMEMTMMDLAPVPPATPKSPPNPAYIETTRESAEEPTEKTFESNANSVAASTQPAQGEAPLPSQEGKEQPFMNLETQDLSLAAKDSAPAPTPVPPPTVAPKATPHPSAPPKPSATPAPTMTPAIMPTPEPEKLAMLTSTPPPALRPTEEPEATPLPSVAPNVPPITERPRPERPASTYQPERQQTRITGRLTNRGPSAVNAVATPLGKYQKQVSDAIGSRWYFYMKERMDLVKIGTAHVEAQVDAKGRVQNLRIISNDSNEAFANICLQSFQEAQIPPIPPDVAATLPEGRLPVDFFFTTYANQ